MTRHLFVDETKAKRYLVVAAAIDDQHIHRIRREIRGLVLPGQRSVHMRSEDKSRRHKIADTVAAFAELGVHAIIYDASAIVGTDLSRRARSIHALVEDAAGTQQLTHIVFDMDQTLLSFDRQRMIESLRTTGARALISYEHLPFAHELALSVPDVIAWCWARGNEWRQRVKPIVAEVRQL